MDNSTPPPLRAFTVQAGTHSSTCYPQGQPCLGYLSQGRDFPSCHELLYWLVQSPSYASKPYKRKVNPQGFDQFYPTHTCGMVLCLQVQCV